MKLALPSELSPSGHIFLFSALASQIMSNVTATLLFAQFTTNWEALLWGVNAGGFGAFRVISEFNCLLDVGYK